jgi:hypothetical protein
MTSAVRANTSGAERPYLLLAPRAAISQGVQGQDRVRSLRALEWGDAATGPGGQIPRQRPPRKEAGTKDVCAALPKMGDGFRTGSARLTRRWAVRA